MCSDCSNDISKTFASLLPWYAVLVFKESKEELEKKALDDLPEYITAIAEGTLGYEQAIRVAWDKLKALPSDKAAREFIETLKRESKQRYEEVLKAVLELDELYPVQIEFLEKYLREHYEYLEDALLPDIMTAMSIGTPVDVKSKLGSMDYRVIVMYAGALWGFGMLSTIVFDGIQLRDALSLFMFSGPNDERTCTGPRGCAQHVGQVYTVAQILLYDIIPGHMKCGGNCRHMLFPILLWPDFKGKTKVACLERGCIRYRGAVDNPFGKGLDYVCDAYPFGIPSVIVSGKDKHMVSRGDDMGITYLGPELWSPGT